jgi:GntR family transcriptional regulator/MocR family aminotransferase
MSKSTEPESTVIGVLADASAAAPGQLLKALHRALREAIVSGRLTSGVRLPPTRALAQALGISRNTAMALYDLLASEGYVAARGKGGTSVAGALPKARKRGAQAAGEASPPKGPWLKSAWFAAAASAKVITSAPALALAHDFTVGVPAIAPLPFAVLRRLTGRALRDAERSAAEYSAPQGLPRMRAAIAAHVSATRAVACSPQDVIVTQGAQQAFDLLARVLVAPGQTAVAIEDPGYPPLRSAFIGAGARLTPVAVDDEGLVVDAIPAGSHIVCVTPSHQFPRGVTLSAGRRRQLMRLAQDTPAVVIEDDYDSEFRFGRRPLDALKTLDREGRVFYVGTFSKSLYPALRLGYIVAPRWALAALAAAKQAADWHSCTLTQEAVAAFIEEGHLLRHARRMQAIYRGRREALIDAVGRHLGAAAEVLPCEAGLHMAIRLTGRAASPRQIALRAIERGVRVETLARYALAPRDVAPRDDALLFGYGRIEAAQMDDAIRRLSRCLG